MKTIQSIDRAVAILDAVAEEEPTLAELSRKLALPPTTVHGFVATMRHWNLLYKNEETGRLCLGSHILKLAACCDRQQTLIRLVHPHLEVIVEKFDETAHMAVPDGSDILYLDKVECRRPFRMTSMVGKRETFFESAIGLVLAANLSGLEMTPAEQKLLARNVDGRTALLFHVDIELYCLSVAVFDHRHTPVLGLSVAVPQGRFDKKIEKSIFKDLLSIADEIQHEF